MDGAHCIGWNNCAWAGSASLSEGPVCLFQMTTMVKDMNEQERMGRMYRTAAIVMVVFTAVLLASMFGLTWAVVARLKDTEVLPHAHSRSRGSRLPSG